MLEKKMSQFGKVKVKTTWLSLEKLFFFFLFITMFSPIIT